MMRFWVIAALTAVTLAVTACGAAPAEDRSLRTTVGQTQTADGARVNLEWAYADEKFVAVGLHTQRLEGAQKPEGSDSGSNSAALEPVL
jgi:hypothetical protein